jgi:hypothetical protein
MTSDYSFINSAPIEYPDLAPFRILVEHRTDLLTGRLRLILLGKWINPR